MSNDDLTRTSTATTTDNLIPVNLDREPIIFSDNDASIEGILYEVGRFYKRTGQFQMLFKHRAVSLSNGKLAVESLNSVYWTTGSIASSAGFDAPCLPTATRYNDYVSRATAAGAKIPKDLTGGAAPDHVKDSIVLAPHVVETNDALLLKSLSHVFGAAESVESLFDDADGSGLALLASLRARAAKHGDPTRRTASRRTGHRAEPLLGDAARGDMDALSPRKASSC